MQAIGIDIGGTKIALGLVDDGRILKRYVIPNRYYADPERMVAAIGEYAGKLVEYAATDAGDGGGGNGRGNSGGSGPVRFIGAGCPGWVVDGVVYEAVNLGIPEFRLAEALSARCGLPSRVENDARTALLCEWRHGALGGSENGAMVTFGTGIGGALLLGRRLYRGSFGCAGEIGHLTLSGGTEPCPCGKTGCFETTASVNALVKLARRHGLETANGLDVCAMAEAGNEVAGNVLAQYTDAAAEGIVELAMLLDLDTVAVGGAISRQRKLFVQPLRDKVNRLLPRCRVVAAAFTNDAGIIGAAELGEGGV